MPRQPVTIGTHTFPSKSAAYAYFRDILERTEDLEPLTGDDADDVEALLNNHENADRKIGPGVLGYCVATEEDKGSRCFHAYRKDGQFVHFSYKKAVDGYTKPRARFMAAARAACEEDVQSHKTAYFEQYAGDDGMVIVPDSNRLHARHETHVDHDPPFRKLVDDFMNVEGVTAEQTAYATNEAAGTRFEDQSLADRFRDYHARHAHFTIIAGADNLRKAWEARADRSPKTVITH